jgi:hypothetical protein
MSYEKFSADNAAMLLIDHQVGTMGWAKSMPFEELKRASARCSRSGRINLSPNRRQKL